jgi:glyoxylase-like metal-dependent hydrolase (beta-lactamase superfamily II)
MRLASAAVSFVLAPVLVAAAPPEVAPLPGGTPLVIATHVAGFAQEHAATALVESLRTFGGELAETPVVVVVDDLEQRRCERLRALGARVVQFAEPAAALKFPYGAKVFAAAEVEALVAGRARALAWLDAETLVLAPPRELLLERGEAVALRPVFLANRVALAPDAPLDAFWARVYREVGADAAAAAPVRSLVDEVAMRAYLNCMVIAVRPERSLFRDWLRHFRAVVADEAYLRAAVADPPHRIFLHQAVLTAVLVGRTTGKEWRWLTPRTGYPANLHDRVPAAWKAKSLDGLAVVSLDQLWAGGGRWEAGIGASPALGAWIEARRRDRLQVVPGILREEGESNAYLLTTPAGTVVIDPGGARATDSALRAAAGKAPLRAVIVTHGHDDHRLGIDVWRGATDVPVIAHEGLAELVAYHDMLSGFFTRRVTVQAGREVRVPADDAGSRVLPTVTFAIRHDLEVGGLRLAVLHTPGETPDAATVWVPELGAAFVGDLVFGAFPALYTPRGTRPRWALDWARSLDRVIALEPEVLLPGHEEPTFGRAAVRRVLERYRDAIRFVHDATVRGMNEGKDVRTLMREVALPAELRLPEYYGRVSWAVRAIYEGYAGWYDGDPASLYAEPPTTAFPDLVRLAGGPDAVARLAEERLAAGEALAALHLADAALAAAPGHEPARRARLGALQALRTTSRNGIERNWLAHAIRALEPEAAASR